MTSIKIELQPRELIGRKSKRLRSQGLIPGVIYGNNFTPVNVQLDAKTFAKAYAQVGQTSLLDASINGETLPVKIQEVAINPVSDAFIHVDFYKVNLKEKITATIPLVFVGESEAVKNLGAILVRGISEIEVEGLPQEIPHEIHVDLSQLKDLSSRISAGDLPLPKGITMNTDPEITVASVQVQEEEVFETTTPTVEDVELIKKEKKEDETAEE